MATETSGCELTAFVVGINLPCAAFNVQVYRKIQSGTNGVCHAGVITCQQHNHAHSLLWLSHFPALHSSSVISRTTGILLYFKLKINILIKLVIWIFLVTPISNQINLTSDFKILFRRKARLSRMRLNRMRRRWSGYIVPWFG